MGLIALFIQYPVVAQSNSGIRAYFVRDSVIVKMGQIFDNHLVIENNTAQALYLSLAQSDLLALIPLPDTILLSAHQTRTFYIQHLAEPKLFERIHENYQVDYLCYHTAMKQGEPKRITAGYKLVSQEGSKVSLTLYNSTYFMDPKASELKVQLLCRNTGIKNVRLSFEVKSYPQAVALMDNQTIYQLIPGQQQQIELTLKMDQKQTAAMDYNLEITALDQSSIENSSGNSSKSNFVSAAGSARDKVVLGVRRIKIVQLGSNKTWGNTHLLDKDMIGHQVELSYRQSGTNYSYTHLMGEGRVDIGGQNNVQYRFNYNGYIRPFTGSEIYDSYLRWERPGLSLALGSISENMDYNLYGQGVQATIDWSGPGSLSALYVKRNYLIYSDMYAGLPQEQDIALRYKWDPGKRLAKQDDKSATAKDIERDQYGKEEKLGGVQVGPMEVHYIHADDPLTSTLTHIVSGQMELREGQRQRLLVEAGGSREYSRPDDYAQEHKDGWSAGVHYNAHWSAVNLGSDNYTSSAYYGGLRRGALSLNENVSLNLKKGWMTSWQYSRQKNAPAYMDRYYMYNSPKTDKVQYSWSVSKNAKGLSVYLKPYILEQSLNQKFMAEPIAFSSDAIRAELTLIKKIAHSQLSLSADFGKVKTDNPYVSATRYQSWRLMGSYNYKIFSINANFQNGPYYIMEEPAPWQYSGYKNYAIGPSFHFSGLNNNLQVQASDYLNYNGYQKQWNHYLSASGQYQLKRDVLIKADAYMNVYTNRQYRDFVQFSIGAVKTFRKNNAPGHHSWKLYFFKDLNANGKWDKGETAAGGVIAQVGDAQLKTAANGKVVLANLPEGHYQLQLLDGKGWTLNHQMAIDLKSNTNTYIGLTQCIAVTGLLVIDSTQLSGKLPNVEGIQIAAKEVQTGRKYTTYSNALGGFEFQLPKGSYEVMIGGQNPEFTVQEKSIHLDLQNNVRAAIAFHLKDRARAVNVQEF